MRRLRDNIDNLCSAVCAGLPPQAAVLDRIYRKVSSEGYCDESSVALEQEIKAVSERFGISSKAAVLLAVILENSCKGGCDEDDMAKYIGCSYIEFIGFLSSVRELEDRGIITARRSGRENSFVVSSEAFKAIEKDTGFVPLKRSGLSAEELFSRFRLCYSEFGRGDIDCERLLEELEQLISDNQQLEFCAKTSEALSNPNFCDSEKRFFLTLCNRYIGHGDKSVPIDRLIPLTDYLEDEQKVRRCLASGHSDLQRCGLVTFGGEKGFQDTDSLALSEEVRRTFFTEISPAREPSVKNRDLIPSSAIKPRELFYDGTVKEQMDHLAELLDPLNFAGVQERLGELGMRNGFAVLFSSSAGCGKTAGAYELARCTGRDVYAVDISELKSKWVGNSEKIVKGVFTTYRRMCRTSERTPILLFNEADAIFSKRLQSPQDSVDQMMNSIQNICLDAIENLEGILIATTNLASNFCDEAFARRFIYKVEFTKPEAETRAKIWKSLIGGLSEENAVTLASKYDFSGGNIENIARKAAVSYVLHGTSAELKELIGFCEEEMLCSQGSSRRIGFQS